LRCANAATVDVPIGPFLIVEKTLADRDALGGMMVHHLEADPFLFRQPMQIQCDVAVDVAEALVAGIGEGAGEIRYAVTSWFMSGALEYWMPRFRGA